MEDLFCWVQAVTPDMLPEAPFPLGHGVTVLDPARWLASVQRDARSELRPRAKWGALQEDLRRLKYELTTVPGSGEGRYT